MAREVVLDANVLVGWLDKTDSLAARTAELIARLRAEQASLSLLDILVGEAVSVVIAYVASRVMKFKSFKGMIFGARLERLVGEVNAQGDSVMAHVVRVHTLSSSKPARAVGIEIVAKSILSYQMLPVTLSPHDALRLAAMLQEAANESSAATLKD